jgi:hypothetical protein
MTNAQIADIINKIIILTNHTQQVKSLKFQNVIIQQENNKTSYIVEPKKYVKDKKLIN